MEYEPDEPDPWDRITWRKVAFVIVAALLWTVLVLWLAPRGWV